MKRKNGIGVTILLFTTLIIGMGLILYPSFSNWWNKQRQTIAIANYDSKVAELDNSDKEAILEKAAEYNRKLAELSAPFTEFEEENDYENILDITGTGIMGYITIPKINVYLPIYHGTSPEVLNIAVGHLNGTSLPVGGSSCHSVISAHRGLPSAKLFSDIDQLIEDDTFTITVLDEVLTYEVDQSEVILPTDFNLLNIVPNMDYVTLMTCTPYGVNTHRLLVRAHRIDTLYPRTVKVSADASYLDELTLYSLIIVVVLILLLIYCLIYSRVNRKRKISVKSVYDVEIK